MIFESAIKQYKIEESNFELPTELDIVKEFYENEISFLNMTIGYKDALGAVNESYIEAIHEGYMENIQKKIKEYAKKIMEYFKKVIDFLKNKIKENTKSIKNKLQKASNTKILEDKKLKLNVIDTKFIYDAEDRWHAGAINDFLEKVNQDDDWHTVDEVGEKLEKFHEEELDIKDYIFTAEIDNKNKNEFITNLNNTVKVVDDRATKAINVLKANQNTFNTVLKNYESWKDGSDENKIKSINEQIRAVNLIMNEYKLNMNLYITHIQKYISYTTGVINKLVEDK